MSFWCFLIKFFFWLCFYFSWKMTNPTVPFERSFYTIKVSGNFKIVSAWWITLNFFYINKLGNYDMNGFGRVTPHFYSGIQIRSALSAGTNTEYRVHRAFYTFTIQLIYQSSTSIEIMPTRSQYNSNLLHRSHIKETIFH